MNRLVLIDGNAILHRAYHALPPLTNAKGEQTNAVYGFVTITLKVVQNLKPSHLAVVFDRPAPTFRKKLFEKYQANRPKMEVGLSSQIEYVHKVVSSMKIPIYEQDGFEADDILATIAQQVRESQRDCEVIIVTGDRDLMQLVDESTKLYMPLKGLSDSKLYEQKDVYERMGVNPSQIIDYKALVGDASDNYPGVDGVGPKTAAALIAQFKSVDNLYAQLSMVKNEKLRQKLEKYKDDAMLSKTLATVLKDVPIKYEFDKSVLTPFDRLEVHIVFDELGFRSLIPRLSINNKSAGKVELKKEEVKTDEHEQRTLF